jgi:hypothetical protein
MQLVRLRFRRTYVSLEKIGIIMTDNLARHFAARGALQNSDAGGEDRHKIFTASNAGTVTGLVRAVVFNAHNLIVHLSALLVQGIKRSLELVLHRLNLLVAKNLRS